MSRSGPHGPPRAPAVFAVVVGALMVGMWSFFIATGQVPEFEQRPAEIAFHLAAELCTAVGLLGFGSAVLAARRWGPPGLLAAFGMLAYTLVVSPGYYAQRGQGAFALMFGVLLAATAVFAVQTAAALSRPPRR